MLAKGRSRAEKLRRRHDLEVALHSAHELGVAGKFLEDVFSAPELERAANRWLAADSLMGGMTQRATVVRFGIGKGTVGRMAKCIDDGEHATGAVRRVYDNLQPPGS